MARRLRLGVLVALLFGACSDDPPACMGAACEGLVVAEASGPRTTEAGGQVTLTLRLERAPSADVRLALSVDEPSEASLGTAEVTFTPENWNGVQTVVVTGVDDDLVDGEQPYHVVFAALQSADSAFDGFVPAPIALANTDDESAGVTVGAPDGDTGENGDQASFTVVLDARPDASVRIALASSDLAEGTASPAILEFTPENYAAPQTVTVTGIDDDLADGPQTYQIVFERAESEDPDYQGLATDAVDLVNVDDDTAGISVGAISGTTGENGSQASFTVVLNSAPTADVSFALASTDEGEGTAGAAMLTFTTVNWAAPQTVVVTGQDDDSADGAQAYAIAFEAAQSADETYAGLIPGSVDLINVDDDTAGITVSAIDGDTGEDGDQASFTVVLDSEPSGDVMIGLATNDAGEGTPVVSSLVFTAANWNAPQTVTLTGQDDDVADGNQPYAIVFAGIMSADAAYAAITLANVAVTNVDDDSAGITIGPISGTTGEDGDQASFTVVLESEPFADVSISLGSNDAGEGTPDRTSLVFTAANWNAPQTVTLTGQDDDLADGNQPYAIVFGATTSTDTAYDAITPSNVAVTNVDDDSAGITISPVSGNTSEAGGQATFSVVLDSEPFADVTLGFGSNDLGEGTLDRSSLVFTAANWNAPQTVTLTGRDDELDDGNQPYAVVFTAAASTDAAYAAITPSNVAVINTDDDSAGITVTTVVGASTEMGGGANVSVVLDSEPFGDVTVSFASSDASEGIAGASSLTFTTVNWASPQTILVTGQDDDLADGNQPYALVFGATTSTDPAYAAITPANAALTNTDDDSAGIVVSAASGPTTEAGGTATFSVVLRSEPFANVTLSFASNDPGEGTTGVTSLTFTAANWDAPRSVTITGQNDDLDDGNQPYAIVFGATTSTDAAYAAITPPNVAVTNTDNDTAGITVTPTSGNTSENGGVATFTAVLNSQPTASVTLSYASSDLTEGTVSPGSITFTTTNWNVPQSIRVTGVDDALFDGNQIYRLTFAPSASADPGYNGLAIPQRNLTNVDDDLPPVGTTGTTGVNSGDPWIVCRADASTAWVAANNEGEYNPTMACQSLGYSGVNAWGGTCGTVCGYCGSSNETYDNAGGGATSLRYTVQWRCVR